MIVNKIIVITLLVLFGCGKVQELKLKSKNQSSLGTETDVKLVEVQEGVFYKGDEVSENYLEFSQVQYKIGTLTSEAQETLDALPLKTRTNIYFKGMYKKEPLESNPSVEIDVVDLTILKVK